MKIVSYLFLILSWSGLALAQESAGIESSFSMKSIDDYEQTLLEDRVELSKMSSVSPQKNLKAVVFFENGYALDSLLSSDIVERLNVTGFRHGDSERSGGYKLREGESLSEAIESYRVDHIKFLQRDESNMRSIMASSSDDQQVKDAASARLRSVVRRQSDYLKNGMRVVGLEVDASSRGLIEIWDDKNYNIRTIKIKESLPVPNKFD